CGAVQVDRPLGRATALCERKDRPSSWPFQAARSITGYGVTAGFRLNFEAANWSMRMDLRYHAAKDASDVDPTAGVRAGSTQFTAVPAAATLDVTGQWRIRKDLRLTAGVVNLTNAKYWLWSDVQGLTTVNAATQLDAYTQPGRHVNLSLVMDF
ncbi:MAG: TonB-dependent receptor, partial [Burkholderiales bacterium]|nr:TonB-dependent receptor [Burkholderiales bacterium]